MQSVVSKTIAGHDLMAPMLLEQIKAGLKDKGYFIVSNFPLEHKDSDQIHDSFFQICEAIGQPISHDKKGTLIWDIKSKPPSKNGGGVITYSEHNHDADLHTDSQYSESPEDYFALLTLHRSRCGGGVSHLLSVKDIIEELNSTVEGRETLEIISTTSYPFIVPNVFKKEQSAVPEFNFGYILNGGDMRFRVDTIQKALDYNPDFCTKSQIKAFKFLVNLVRTTDNTKSFFLEDRDLIFINNKTVLHGRSSFSDYNRHLLRIRMNKHQKTETKSK